MVIRRWITLAGIALIVLIVAADSYEAWQDYRTAISSDEHAELALGRALAEQTARMVQEVDLVLAAHTDWAASPEGRHANAATTAARLRADFGRLPFVRTATATAANGSVVATTRDDNDRIGSLAQPAAFTSPPDDAGGALHIGRPYVASRDGSLSLSLSRRMTDAQGAFNGVVVANLAFNYLTDFYAGVDIPPDTLIRVSRQDGVVLSQYPVVDNLMAEDRQSTAHWPQPDGAASWVGREESAGKSRVTALLRVTGYPLVVEVSRDLKAIIQPWRQRELASAARTLTLALLAAALLMALRLALSRRDRLERELEKAQRADALGFLAASVAHDFNNVLAAIVGYAELARNAVAGGGVAQSNIDRLLAATERARLMVRRVLTFNPRRSTDYRPVLIQPIIAEVIEQVRATLPRSISVRTSGAERVPPVGGDATELYQVIMNLCSNAVRAMPQGGALELRLELLVIAAAQPLSVGTLPAGRCLCLSVTDTGTGIDAGKLDSIFEPFYTTREHGQGSGIGLAVVRNIVTRMGGAIGVRSDHGVGTTVSVYWPLPANDELLTEAGPESSRQQGRGESVLIVDDEPELVTLVEELLASLGYEPVGFTSARAALDNFRRDPSRFDLVLTDERMPGLRGVEFAAQVHAANCAVPIVMMTGHRDADLDARARDAGIGQILDKPIRGSVLQATLQRWLRPEVATATPPGSREMQR